MSPGCSSHYSDNSDNFVSSVYTHPYSNCTIRMIVCVSSVYHPYTSWPYATRFVFQSSAFTPHHLFSSAASLNHRESISRSIDECFWSHLCNFKAVFAFREIRLCTAPPQTSSKQSVCQSSGLWHKFWVWWVHTGTLFHSSPCWWWVCKYPSHHLG